MILSNLFYQIAGAKIWSSQIAYAIIVHKNEAVIY